MTEKLTITAHRQVDSITGDEAAGAAVVVFARVPTKDGYSERSATGKSPAAALTTLAGRMPDYVGALVFEGTTLPIHKVKRVKPKAADTLFPPEEIASTRPE